MEDFQITNKIYYHDTDCGGVVYYGAYSEHLEESRSEFCLSKGVNLRQYASQGIAFAVVHFQIEYKSPARYGDTINISTRVEKIGNSSIHFYQEIKRDNAILAKAKTIWVCIGRDFKTQILPDQIKKALLSQQ